MRRISPKRIAAHLTAGDNATTMSGKGAALEDLICYLFQRVPGISLTKRDVLNVFESEEVDVAFWNRQHADGIYFLPHIILVECKNWSRPVGSEEESWFDAKIGRRGLPFGILVAANGITGMPSENSAAHELIRAALAAGRQLVVVTRSEIQGLRTTDQLGRLVQEKLRELVVSGTLFLWSHSR